MSAGSFQEPVLSTARIRSLARESSRRLAQHLDDDLEVKIAGGREAFTLPREAVRLLVDLLAQLAQGNAVTIVPYHAELTTQQAAEFLGVSRPFIVKQLEAGIIPHRKVGTHRRILFEDLLAHRYETLQKRRASLDELAALAQQEGHGY